MVPTQIFIVVWENIILSVFNACDLFAVVTKYLNEQGFRPYTKGIGYMAFIITVVLLLSWLFHAIIKIGLSKKYSKFLFSIMKKYQRTRHKAVIAKVEQV